MEKFLKHKAINYHDLPYSGEHESVHDLTHKKAWGKLGKQVIKEIALKNNWDFIAEHNPSGDIDRGYVSGFFESNNRNKFVYFSISDGMQDILFRTAKHSTDYTGGSNNNANISKGGFEKMVAFIDNYFN